MIKQDDSYTDFMPIRQSATLYQVDSYTDFMPLRQSSQLGDDTLPMNDTDVYAHTSVVWDYGFQAAQREKKRVRARYNAVNDQVLQETLCVTLPDDTLDAVLDDTMCKTVTSADILPETSGEISDETLWTTALDISFSQSQILNNEDEESRNEVLKLSISERGDQGDTDELNDTLPMDDDAGDIPFNTAFLIADSEFAESGMLLSQK